MHLLDFVNDIFDIAGVNDVDVGVARDMFIANIGNTQLRAAGLEAPLYAGADVDYEALLPHYNELANPDMLNEYNRVVQKFYFEIIELRKEGKRDTVKLLFTGKDEEE